MGLLALIAVILGQTEVFFELFLIRLKDEGPCREPLKGLQKRLFFEIFSLNGANVTGLRFGATMGLVFKEHVVVLFRSVPTALGTIMAVVSPYFGARLCTASVLF